MNTLQTRDFPDWIGPMLVKELRQGLKARAFEITFIALQLILAIVVGYHALLYAREGAGFSADGLHSMFWFIVGLQVLFITPLRALGGLTNERKANTLELIFMTGLSSWRIASGKWLSLFSQSVLFVLAVLPYGVLRYFFGGVNLTEDLIMLAGMLLSSAVLSAIALAISGMPAFIRVGAMILFAMFGISFAQGLMFVAMMGRGMGSFFFSGVGSGFDSVWPLMIYNALLVCIGALAIAANSISPIAENQALRQRLLVLAAWLPIPVLGLFGAPEEAILVQSVFFICLGFAATWYHLSIQPVAMRVHMEPFARRGGIGQLAAFVLQPGWPAAVFFLVLIELIFIGTTASTRGKIEPDVIAVVTMAGAALMTPAFVWRAFRLPTKYTLLLQTIFLGLCAGLMVMSDSLTDSSLGHYYSTAFLPPFGFFSMLDNGLNRTYEQGWMLVGMVAFFILAVLLSYFSRSYWAQVLEHARDIRRTPKTKPAPEPLEVAA